jgi:hypothetical protein
LPCADRETGNVVKVEVVGDGSEKRADDECAQAPLQPFAQIEVLGDVAGERVRESLQGDDFAFAIVEFEKRFCKRELVGRDVQAEEDDRSPAAFVANIAVEEANRFRENPRPTCLP